MGVIKCTCNENEVLYETDTLKVYGDGPHSHPKHEFRIAPHFWYILGGLIFSHFGVVWEMYGKSLLFSPRNVHFTLSKMTIANQTQLTSICFGCDRAALSASSLVGELSVTLRDLPHTLFGSLASNAAPIRYNLRIVTDIAIVGPRTLATAGA